MGKMQEGRRKHHKLYAALMVILGAFTTYFAIRIFVVSISDSSGFPRLLSFGMLVSLGLSNVVQAVEMFVTEKSHKGYLVLLLISAVFALGVAFILLLV